MVELHRVATHNHLLYAVATTEGLVVYRSVLVNVEDLVYKPVVEYIRSFGLSEVFNELHNDADMMFGKAWLSLWK